MGGTCENRQMSWCRAPAERPSWATHHIELADLVLLHGSKETLHLELGQYNDRIAPVRVGVRHHHKTVDVAEGQEAQAGLSLDAESFTRDGIVGRVLDNVGDDVVVRDHDGFLSHRVSPASLVPKRTQTAVRTGRPEVPLE